MNNLKRRDALKLALGAGGLLVATNAMALDAKAKVSSFAGTWISTERPCAIFQQGPVLLLVNELGSLGTAHLTGPNTLTILGGQGWDPGLTATLQDRGKRLVWSNETIWTRA